MFDRFVAILKMACPAAYDGVVYFPDRAPILARHVIGGTALLAATCVVNDQHAVGRRRPAAPGAAY